MQRDLFTLTRKIVGEVLFATSFFELMELSRHRLPSSLRPGAANSTRTSGERSVAEVVTPKKVASPAFRKPRSPILLYNPHETL